MEIKKDLEYLLFANSVQKVANAGVDEPEREETPPIPGNLLGSLMDVAHSRPFQNRNLTGFVAVAHADD